LGDGNEETKRAGRPKSTEAAEGLRALVIGEGSSRQSRASTPMTTVMTVFIASCCPGATPRGMRLVVKGPKALTGKEEYRLKTSRRSIKV
jgi:hypothetical protein